MEEMPKMKTPACVEFRPSGVEKNKIGVWVKNMIKDGSQFGPYGGEKKRITDHCDPYYSWEIRGPKGRRLFCIDAANPKKSNWMRYIKCARYNEEQNMIALQQQKQIYYKTIKDVQPNEELLCWFNIRTESLKDHLAANENNTEEQSESTNLEESDRDKDSKTTEDIASKTSQQSEDSEMKTEEDVEDSKTPKKGDKQGSRSKSPVKRKQQIKDGKQNTGKQQTTQTNKKKTDIDNKDKDKTISSKRKNKAETASAAETTPKDENMKAKTVTDNEDDDNDDDNEELPVLDKTPEDHPVETGETGDNAEESDDCTREEAMPVLEKMSPDSELDPSVKTPVSSGKKIVEADSTTMEIDEDVDDTEVKCDLEEEDDDAEGDVSDKSATSDSKSADSTFEDNCNKHTSFVGAETKRSVDPVYLPPRLDQSGQPIIYTDIRQFKYEITDANIIRWKRRKPMYKCTLCSCMVEYPHSLRRHYFKHHVEDKHKNLAPTAKPAKIAHQREKIRTRASSCEDKKSLGDSCNTAEFDKASENEMTESEETGKPSKEVEVEMEDEDDEDNELLDSQNDDDGKEDEDDDGAADDDASDTDALVIDEDRLSEVTKDVAKKPTYPCKLCGKVLKSPKRLSNHMLTHPKQGIMECPKCYRKFLCKQGLERHLLTHTGEKPHLCKYCGKGFSTTTNVRRHERLHSRDKKHPCKRCTISFIQASDLQKHLLSEHGEVQDSTSYGTDELPSEDTAEDEEKIPEGSTKKKMKLEQDSSTQAEHEEEIHSCPWCRKIFNNPTSLKRHASHAHRDVYSKPSKKKFKYGSSVVNTDEEDEADSYVDMSGLSDSISENLSKYLDGKIQTNQDEDLIQDGEDLSDQGINSEMADTNSRSFTVDAIPLTNSPGSQFSKSTFQIKTLNSGSIKSTGDSGKSILGSVLTESAKSRFMPAIKQHVQKLVKSGTTPKPSQGSLVSKQIKDQGKVAGGVSSRRSSDSSSVKSVDSTSDIILPPSPYTRPPYQGSSGPKDCGIFIKTAEAHSLHKGQRSSSKSQSKSPQRSPSWMASQKKTSASGVKSNLGATRSAGRSPRGPFFKPREMDTPAKTGEALKCNIPASQGVRMTKTKQYPSPIKVLNSPTSITQNLKQRSPIYNPQSSTSKIGLAKTAKAMPSPSQKSPIGDTKPVSFRSSPSKTSSIPTSPLFSASHPLKRQASYTEPDDVLDLSIKRPRDEDKNAVSKPYTSLDSDMPLDLSCPSTSETTPRSKNTFIFSKENMQSSTLTKTGLSSQVTTLYTRSEGLLARAGYAITKQSWNQQSVSQSDGITAVCQEDLLLMSPTDEKILTEEEMVDSLSANKDKAFTCNVCKAPYSSMKDLHQHVTVHADDWKFKCEFCIQLYKDANLLVQHRSKKHRVGKTYACSACNREFSYLSNLEQHQVDLHPNVRCSYTELGAGILRRQNFTDPAKSVVPKENASSAAEQGRISQLIEQASALKFSPRKADGKDSSPRKPVNPQRHHPFLGLRPGIDLLGTATVESAQEYVNSLPTNQCTKCNKTFDDVTAFHEHIFICAGRMPGKRRKRGSRKGRPPKNSNQGGSDARRYNLGFGFSKKLKQKAMKQTSVIGKVFRARPGQKFYNPLNHTRRREKADLLDTYKCQACQREFTNITNLERHMKVCPNRDKLRKETLQKTLEKIGEGYDEKSKELLQQHRCPHCTRQFTYLQSLKKHTEICNMRKDADGNRIMKAQTTTKQTSSVKGRTTKGTKRRRTKHGGRKKRQRDETVTAEQLVMMEILGDRPKKKYKKRAKTVETHKVTSKESLAQPMANTELKQNVVKATDDSSKVDNQLNTTIVEKYQDITKVHFVNEAATQSILEKRLREEKQTTQHGEKDRVVEIQDNSLHALAQNETCVGVSTNIGENSSNRNETDSEDGNSIDSDELPLATLMKTPIKKGVRDLDRDTKVSMKSTSIDQETKDVNTDDGLSEKITSVLESKPNVELSESKNEHLNDVQDSTESESMDKIVKKTE